MAAASKKIAIKGSGFRNLLIFLLLYIVGSPFLTPYPSLAVFAHLSLTMAMFFAIYTVQKQQQQRSVAMALLLPLIILYWLGIYDVISFSRPGSYAFFVIYFGLLLYSYIVQIAHAERVTSNVLYAAFCLYLVIGMFWGALYALLSELSPGAYSGVLLENSQTNPIHVYNYFSMITLTTLGYGDITPQTAGAASLCQMEAIVGQFFTAVLVAWLVGMYISEKQSNKSTD
jgi:voltage-gated potassium channel